ncbi:beta-xylosidase [Paenibacillus sp. V4I9]|uniref:glycoside hydrolase family 43 protein n=1 Tax=Paenibacillus sp. V4I9 TaxID=3042308 RepID=UPI0027895F10|nr:glycoside hydrolase 43 family protein [Paenibacillus sp. V4I9]MDQ0885124.1 beta-xylosidase [Paenibacillus sp. V4I9]
MKITPIPSSVWTADLGNGFYRNPILYADYSDLDIVRVGNDFYMTASSFVSTPGLPILHSNDLVNWTLIGHAIDQLPDGFEGRVRHGDGVWAPSIRHHNGTFYIYFGAPDEGIFMTTAQNPTGPWSPLHLVKAVKGWIDPCPFWDEDGHAYLVHAFANSRCGIKHKLNMCRMKPDGTALLDDGSIVFDGTVDHPTMEGPKLYKRNGYYYIFAPAGGVKTGWQTILRSRSIFGPYEDKIVLHQGHTDVNGPHQGGYVELDSGESWFMHFQDREAYGRIVHLQPMGWENDWPTMGIDSNGDGIGEPVSEYRKPNTGSSWPIAVPATSDEFDHSALGLQWQWQGNSRPEWLSLTASPGQLRLMAHSLPKGASTLYDAPNVLCQKLPAPELTVTTKLTLYAGSGIERAGLTVFGHKYRYISLESSEAGLRIVLVSGEGSKEGASERLDAEVPADISTVYLRVTIVREAKCLFQISFDGEAYETLGDTFDAMPGGWVGAKIGLFCLQLGEALGSGYADFDWFHVENKDSLNDS